MYKKGHHKSAAEFFEAKHDERRPLSNKSLLGKCIEKLAESPTRVDLCARDKDRHVTDRCSLYLWSVCSVVFGILFLLLLMEPRRRGIEIPNWRGMYCGVDNRDRVFHGQFKPEKYFFESDRAARMDMRNFPAVAITLRPELVLSPMVHAMICGEDARRMYAVYGGNVTFFDEKCDFVALNATLSLSSIPSTGSSTSGDTARDQIIATLSGGEGSGLATLTKVIQSLQAPGTGMDFVTQMLEFNCLSSCRANHRSEMTIKEHVGKVPGQTYPVLMALGSFGWSDISQRITNAMNFVLFNFASKSSEGDHGAANSQNQGRDGAGAANSQNYTSQSTNESRRTYSAGDLRVWQYRPPPTAKWLPIAEFFHHKFPYIWTPLTFHAMPESVCPEDPQHCIVTPLNITNPYFPSAGSREVLRMADLILTIMNGGPETINTSSRLLKMGEDEVVDVALQAHLGPAPKGEGSYTQGEDNAFVEEDIDVHPLLDHEDASFSSFAGGGVTTPSEGGEGSLSSLPPDEPPRLLLVADQTNETSSNSSTLTSATTTSTSTSTIVVISQAQSAASARDELRNQIFTTFGGDRTTGVYWNELHAATGEKMQLEILDAINNLCVPDARFSTEGSWRTLNKINTRINEINDKITNAFLMLNEIVRNLNWMWIWYMLPIFLSWLGFRVVTTWPVLHMRLALVIDTVRGGCHSAAGAAPWKG